MEKDWSQLTPQEKRQRRFEQFLNPPNVSFRGKEAENSYKKRAKRLIDVYNLEKPDEIPVLIHVGAMPAYQYGFDYKTVMYDYEKALFAWKRFNEEFDLDYILSPGTLLPGKIYDLLDYRLYRWPGHGLPDNAIGYQFVEGEYMKEEEYELLLRDPSDFFMRVYMPRVFGAFEPYRMLNSLISIIELPSFYFMPYIFEPLQLATKTLIEVGRELSLWMESVSKFTKERMELGYPVAFSGVLIKSPFDIVGDTLRGTKGVIQDMYRRPDALLKAMDVLAEMTIDYATSSLKEGRGLSAIFPLHKGADGWMSEKQFDTFYFPPLKKIIERLIDEGILVILFAEGSFNTRLDRFKEFPKGSIHLWLDRTDMKKAKEILGGICSISGNVPGSLLITGNPTEVEAYCRELLELFIDEGGYILSTGTADVTQAKYENVKAMIKAAKTYGRR